VEPDACRGCGLDLSGAAQAASGVLQVAGIPGVRALVTGYLLVSRRCGCGTVTKADAPEGAAGGPVCHGPDLTAAALLCHAFGQLGQERAGEVVSGLFGTGVPAGWISKIAARLAGSLHRFEDDVKTALLAEPVTLADVIIAMYGAQAGTAFSASNAEGVAAQSSTFVLIMFAVGVTRSWELLGLRGGDHSISSSSALTALPASRLVNQAESSSRQADTCQHWRRGLYRAPNGQSAERRSARGVR
jgi:hypothetical protein